MVHYQNGTFSKQIELEKQGYKRLFVVYACAGNGIAFTECKTLKDAKEELPFFLNKYGNAGIDIACY